MPGISFLFLFLLLMKNFLFYCVIASRSTFLTIVCQEKCIEIIFQSFAIHRKYVRHICMQMSSRNTFSQLYEHKISINTFHKRNNQGSASRTARSIDMRR